MSERVERVLEDMIFQLGKTTALIHQLKARIEKLEEQQKQPQ
ncbi:hypothetical protein [Domibacillus antri]|nr:hypothetical protein [Domibacillus antri]